MSPILIVALIYLCILAGLALWSRHETHTLSGYYLAGKKLPPWVVAFSTNATGESGWLLLGLTGMAYAVGAHAFWVVAGEVIGIALAWILIARRIKRLSDDSDSITVPDVLVARFGDRMNLLRTLSVLIILVMVGAYVSAQLVATGKAFDGFTGMDYTAGVLIGATIIITYTLVGGYKAVAWTDLIQGVLMLIGLVGLPIYAISTAGGWTEISASLAAQDPGLLTPWGPEGKSTVAIVGIITFMAFSVSFMGAPQLMVRFMSARSEKSLVPAMMISITVILLFDMGAVATGMAGRALFPGLEDQETILPLMATELLNPWLAGVMMVIVLAAIMSTADSLLILASSAVVRDFWQKVLKTSLGERALAQRGKLLTLVLGAGGVLFALNESPLIFWFVVFAWNGLAAAFGPPILCGLWYKGTNFYGALTGMAGGFLATVVWVLVFQPMTYGLSEMIPGFIVGMTLTIGVSHLTRNRIEEATE